MVTKNRISVLITEGSSGSAKETLYCIGEKYDIDFLDPSLFCQCRFTRFKRNAIRCPRFASEPDQYLRFLIKTVRKNDYDVLFPVHEHIYLLAKVRERIEREVAVALPDFGMLQSMQSKSEFVRKLNSLNIPVPKTEIVSEFGELSGFDEYPCYVKLAHSTGGMGVAFIRDRNELTDLQVRFEREHRLATGSEILVQQPAPGIMCVVQAVFQHGRLIAAHCAESLARGVGGGQGLRVSASHPNVVRYVRKLGQRIQWHGAMFLEYFYDPNTGQPLFIECNPRIGETLNAKLCGINLSDLVVRISLGEVLEPVDHPVQEGVRSYSDFFLLLHQAIQGANRRTILQEAFSMMTGRGRYQGGVPEITHPKEDPLSLIPALATLGKMLVNPSSAGDIVSGTVGNYSLPQSGVDKIDQLTEEQLRKFFET